MNEVKIGKLRDRLSHYLKKVRKGAEITIMDRDTPIGRIVPYASNKDNELKMIDPPNGYAGLAKLSFPRGKEFKIDAVEILMEERRKR